MQQQVQQHGLCLLRMRDLCMLLPWVVAGQSELAVRQVPLPTVLAVTELQQQCLLDVGRLGGCLGVQLARLAVCCCVGVATLHDCSVCCVWLGQCGWAAACNSKHILSGLTTGVCDLAALWFVGGHTYVHGRSTALVPKIKSGCHTCVARLLH